MVGAAAALLHAAHHDDVRAVVSLSAFAHPAEVMRRFMADRTVPAEDVHRLLRTACHARLLLVDGDHDLRHALAPHARTLVAFLQTSFEPRD